LACVGAFMRVFAAIVFAVALSASGCERQHGERVIRDHGSQPPTTITTLAKGASVDARPVIDSAKRGVAPAGDSVWPEPSRVVERDGAWDVWFDYRQKLVEVDGKQFVRAQDPAAVKVEVQKADLSAQLIPGR
jgi:hypothetical protein